MGPLPILTLRLLPLNLITSHLSLLRSPFPPPRSLPPHPPLTPPHTPPFAFLHPRYSPRHPFLSLYSSHPASSPIIAFIPCPPQLPRSPTPYPHSFSPLFFDPFYVPPPPTRRLSPGPSLTLLSFFPLPRRNPPPPALPFPLLLYLLPSSSPHPSFLSPQLTVFIDPWRPRRNPRIEFCPETGRLLFPSCAAIYFRLQPK